MQLDNFDDDFKFPKRKAIKLPKPEPKMSAVICATNSEVHAYDCCDDDEKIGDRRVGIDFGGVTLFIKYGDLPAFQRKLYDVRKNMRHRLQDENYLKAGQARILDDLLK